MKEFAITAIGSEADEFKASMAGLRLSWVPERGALECYSGQSHLTATLHGLKIVPKNVRRFLCSTDSGRILIKSSIGADSEVSLLVHLSNKDDLKDLFEF